MSGIFESVPNWQFTENDHKAKIKLDQLRQEAFSLLPSCYKSQKILLLYNQMRNTRLYSALQTLPKGCIHHLHIDCCEDEEFYASHIVNDPIIYLGPKLDCFCVGTKQQAQQKGWVSMQKARARFNTEQAFIKFVSNLTMLNKNQIIENLQHEASSECWNRFQSKITNFFPIYMALHVFKKYLIHVFRKYIKNGYDRVEFRALLIQLTQYDQKGRVVKVHDQKKFTQIFDEAYQVVKKQHSQFTTGVIFFALKYLKRQQNIKILTTVLQQNWKHTIGIDFVQQEDPNGSQLPYDDIANQVLKKFPQTKVKKVYHVGQTKNHLNNNIEIALNSGTVRIGHGINVIQQPQIIELCKQRKICFEKCPLSNLMLSYVKDPRICSAIILLGLGVPITINPDDPGKFGVQDCTMDYYIMFISSNWTLKHLKLIAYHSINHAICSEQTRLELLKSFKYRWEKWVKQFITE